MNEISYECFLQHVKKLSLESLITPTQELWDFCEPRMKKENYKNVSFEEFSLQDFLYAFLFSCLKDLESDFKKKRYILCKKLFNVIQAIGSMLKITLCEESLLEEMISFSKEVQAEPLRMLLSPNISALLYSVTEKDLLSINFKTQTLSLLHEDLSTSAIETNWAKKLEVASCLLQGKNIDVLIEHNEHNSCSNEPIEDSLRKSFTNSLGGDSFSEGLNFSEDDT